MLLRDVMPRKRRAFVQTTLLALSLASLTAKAANAQASQEFASSSDGLVATNSDSGNALKLTSLPSSGAGTGVAAGQSEGSPSGYHRALSRMTFEAGGGFNAPARSSGDYITWGGNFTGGVGYRIVPHVSLLAEYQFIDDKLPGRIIAETGAQGGHAHIWSVTLDPVIDLMPKATNDVYVTGGGGFYRKVTSFTDPEAFEYCDYFYCGVDYQNQVVGHFSSNQGGWNVGAGLTHKIGSRTANGEDRMKLFAEVRYLEVMTPSVVSQPNGLGTTTVAADTKLVPVTLGVRW